MKLKTVISNLYAKLGGSCPGCKRQLSINGEMRPWYPPAQVAHKPDVGLILVCPGCFPEYPRYSQGTANKSQKAKRTIIKSCSNAGCFYCGCAMKRDGRLDNPDRETLDHFIPKAKGGTNAKWNLVVACRQCNGLKADLMPLEFYRLLCIIAWLAKVWQEREAAQMPD